MKEHLIFFGGVFPRVIYDNDTVLVKKVIGEKRKQTNFSLGLEEHYGFESHFCNVAAGNEKGAARKWRWILSTSIPSRIPYL